MTVRDALAMGTRLLGRSLPAERARLEVETLLADTLDRPRAWLFAHPEALLPSVDEGRLLSLVERRADGEPLDYVLGHGDFYGLTLALSPDVLVPRPETETLVEAALAPLAQYERPLVADVGTGSGAIALAIAANHTGARVVATDVSVTALAVAARNCHALGFASRIHMVCGHLLDAIAVRFDLIAANLPYVSTSDLDGPSAAVAGFEPRLALAGGDDGLALVRDFLRQAPSRLAPGGTLLAEIGSMQGSDTSALASRHFGPGKVDVLRDLSGNDRVLRVRVPR